MKPSSVRILLSQKWRSCSFELPVVEALWKGMQWNRKHTMHLLILCRGLGTTKQQGSWYWLYAICHYGATPTLTRPLDVPRHEAQDKSWWRHADPSRMSIPRYQNAFRITIWVFFLFVYSQAGMSLISFDVLHWLLIFSETASGESKSRSRFWFLGVSPLHHGAGLFIRRYEGHIYSDITLSEYQRCIRYIPR